ncbi:MAG: hypothetical protein M3Y42_04060 [Actinomycetota bacterium]|nr:hypothetical protein [Actinomycetota bacterium]
MRSSPTDRGYAVIHDNPDGSSTVYIAAAVTRAGQPEQVSAIHTDVAHVVLGSEVALLTAGNRRWSSRIVDVFDDGQGSVHVQGPWSKTRSLDRFVTAR